MPPTCAIPATTAVTLGVDTYRFREQHELIRNIEIMHPELSIRQRNEQYGDYYMHAWLALVTWCAFTTRHQELFVYLSYHPPDDAIKWRPFMKADLEVCRLSKAWQKNEINLEVCVLPTVSIVSREHAMLRRIHNYARDYVGTLENDRCLTTDCPPFQVKRALLIGPTRLTREVVFHVHRQCQHVLYSVICSLQVLSMLRQSITAL